MLKEIYDTVRFEVWVVIGITILSFLLDKVIRIKKNLPPGPAGLPVVGYLPFITKYPHLKFMKLAQEYGRVFSIYLGSKLVVVLNDADSVREAFAKREFLARPPNSPLDLFGMHTPFFSNDLRIWQEQRRFVVQSMKDLGLGRTKIEGHIQDEIQHFLSVLKATEGKPMNLLKPLTPSMSNNICALVFGQRYKYADPDRLILDEALEEVSTTIGQTAFYIFFPWIKHIPFFSKIMKYEKVVGIFGKIKSYMEEKIRRHKETLDPKNIRDFIDSYLLEMPGRLEKDPQTTFTDEMLMGSVFNLFGAGSETVRSTISWCMYIMAAYPEIQEKVRSEILEVLGASRSPQYLDQKNMVYTQAVIREIMRWKTIVPINVLRYTLDDTVVAGYNIPKGTIAIANFWSVHHDPRHWEDPETFSPERHIEADGTLFKSASFMPFSLGKRSCPGETMATMEIFLYFVSILQQFHVTFPANFKPTYEADLGITYKLKQYEICFTSK